MAMIHLAINGRSYPVDADPQTSLLTVLREHLDLTGSKYGCGEGQCGACTVLIDGKAQRSCITRIGIAHDRYSIVVAVMVICQSISAWVPDADDRYRGRCHATWGCDNTAFI